MRQKTQLIVFQHSFVVIELNYLPILKTSKDIVLIELKNDCNNQIEIANLQL